MAIPKTTVVAIVLFVIAAIVALVVGIILYRLSKPDDVVSTVQPVIKKFISRPKTVVTHTPQNSVYLHWVVDDADSITITPGTATDVTSLKELLVTPTETTIYTLTAKNSASGKTATATYQVPVIAGPIPTILEFNPVPPFYISSLEYSNGLKISYSVQWATDAYITSSPAIGGTTTFPLTGFVQGNTGLQSGLQTFTPDDSDVALTNTFTFELNLYNSTSDYYVGQISFPSFTVGGAAPSPTFGVGIYGVGPNDTLGPYYPVNDLPALNTPVISQVNGAGYSNAKPAYIRYGVGCVCEVIGSTGTASSGSCGVSVLDQIDLCGNFTYNLPPIPFQYPYNISMAGYDVGGNPNVYYIGNVQFVSYTVTIGGSVFYTSSDMTPLLVTDDNGNPNTIPFLTVLGEQISSQAFNDFIDAGTSMYVEFTMVGAPTSVQLFMSNGAQTCTGPTSATTAAWTDTATVCSSTCSSGANTIIRVNLPKINDPGTFCTDTSQPDPQPAVFALCASAQIDLQFLSTDFDFDAPPPVFQSNFFYFQCTC